MAYADLTTEQKASLNSWLALMRGTAGELARMNNHAEVVNTEYTENLGAILAELDNADVIPNTSGLTGAEPLTKAQAVTIVSYLQGALTYNTQAHRGNLAKACGEGNLIG